MLHKCRGLISAILTTAILLLMAAIGFTAEVKAAGTIQILIPYGAGTASGSQNYPMDDAFDGQPSYDTQTQSPAGGSGGDVAPAYANRSGYIDFGENWEDVRITSTWTKYKVWSAGNQVPYAELWWDDDTDTVNDSGLDETNINFNSAVNLNIGSEPQWVKDADVSSDPITPGARYLICRSPSTVTYRALEFAFTGWIESGPAPSPTPTPTPMPGSLYTFTLPSGSSINYWDVQGSFPSVNWQTLDRLYIPAGTYECVVIGNLPDRSPGDPLIITNKDGQVIVNGSGADSMLFHGGSNWILTGKYDPELQTGDADYQGHHNGAYEYSEGTYGIMSVDANNSSLKVGGGATNFELSYMEIAFSGFAGLAIKTDNNPDATMDGVKIHDLYVHDSKSEGMYIGNTADNISQQHKFTNLHIYNNRILRSGSEGLQLSNMGDGVKVYNNVVFLCALEWKDQFYFWQNGCFQYYQRDGSAEIYNNIFIGGAANLMLPKFYQDPGKDTLNPGVDQVWIHDNFFQSSRRYFAFISRGISGFTNDTTKLIFEDNYIKDVVFEYGTATDNVPVDTTDTEALFLAYYNTYNPLYFYNNTTDGSAALVDTLDGENGTSGNVTASGNQADPDLEDIIFEDSTYAPDFDYKRIETWVGHSALYGIDMHYEYGDYVRMGIGPQVYGDGQMYRCIQPGTNTGKNPTASPDVWTTAPAMTDDLRLAPISPYQGIGLLD